MDHRRKTFLFGMLFATGSLLISPYSAHAGVRPISKSLAVGPHFGFSGEGVRPMTQKLIEQWGLIRG